MQTIFYIVTAVAGYLLGSISASILITRYVFHRDLRKEGSGNAGAANAARVFGMKAGVLTFLGDFLKTVLAMVLGQVLGGELGMCIGGGAALIGHCFPIYFKFKGGKAVSAGAAVALMADWRIFLIVLALFGLTALLFKTASISSMSAALGAPIGILIFGCSLPCAILLCFACGLILFMHRANIGRILKGTEPKFKAGSGKKV